MTVVVVGSGGGVKGWWAAEQVIGRGRKEREGITGDGKRAPGGEMNGDEKEEGRGAERGRGNGDDGATLYAAKTVEVATAADVLVRLEGSRRLMPWTGERGTSDAEGDAGLKMCGCSCGDGRL